LVQVQAMCGETSSVPKISWKVAQSQVLVQVHTYHWWT